MCYSTNTPVFADTQCLFQCIHALCQTLSGSIGCAFWGGIHTFDGGGFTPICYSTNTLCFVEWAFDGGVLLYIVVQIYARPCCSANSVWLQEPRFMVHLVLIGLFYELCVSRHFLFDDGVACLLFCEQPAVPGTTLICRPTVQRCLSKRPSQSLVTMLSA